MQEPIRRVRPTVSTRYLANPHKGCCTFQRFNGDPLFSGVKWSEEGPTTFPPAVDTVVEGYLPTTVSYCRWFWRLMEPEKGQHDFSVIDDALETCRLRGQTLAVRLMSFGSARQPQVPDWYAKICSMIERPNQTPRQFVPVHDSPEYLEHWGGFIRGFAARYDAHPLLESIDITFIGPWGEGNGECSAEQIDRFTQLWKEAFVKTPRITLMTGGKMRAGIASGAGWRCDCYGDLMNRGTVYWPRTENWNHMYDCYPYEILACGAQDVWKTAPIHLETCWVPMTWHREKFDVDFILQQGLKYHATYFMPKSTRLPEAWMDKLQAFCDALGYRYLFHQAILPRQVKTGEPFRFQAWIENTGVAPIYRRYDFAMRLRQDCHESIVVFDDVDIRTWLPGDVWIDRPISIPPEFRKGWIELSAGIIDPVTRQGKVSFAAQEVYSDRWLNLGGLEWV